MLPEYSAAELAGLPPRRRDAYARTRGVNAYRHRLATDPTFAATKLRDWLDTDVWRLRMDLLRETAIKHAAVLDAALAVLRRRGLLETSVRPGLHGRGRPGTYYRLKKPKPRPKKTR